MDKLLYFPATDRYGDPTATAMFPRSGSMEKVATGYPDQVQKYIDGMQPDLDKFLYMLLHAVGAGEIWGANVNGDYFPEESLRHDGLDYGHKTFERYAKLYKHHVNKDPKKSYGDVLHSFYDPEMHRVLLIIAIDRSKAPDICERIECKNEFPDVSMGCKVPYDVCSICHHKAKSPKEYCDHARYEMNKIYPDGRKVYVSNPHPRFFDISQVFIGAERPAKMLHKIACFNGSQKIANRIYQEPRISYRGYEKMASAGLFMPSSVLADKLGYSVKESEITKEVPAGESSVESPGQNQEMIMRGMSKVRSCEPSMSSKSLSSMSKHPLKNILATLTSMGISIKPSEFQKIVLVKMGHSKLADILDKNNIQFDEFDSNVERICPITYTVNDVTDDIKKIASDYSEDRSDLQPFFFKRVMKTLHNEKNASIFDGEPSRTNVAPALAGIATLYLAYKAGLLKMISPLEKAVEGVARMAGAKDVNPASVIPIATAAAAAMQGVRGFSDPPGRPELIGKSDRIKFANARNIAVLSGAVLAPYVAREMAIRKARKGEEVGPLDKLVYRHPGKLSLISLLAAPNAVRGAQQVGKFVSKYKNQLSQVGSTIKGSMPKIENVVKLFSKQSSDNRYRRLMEDVVMNNFWGYEKISSSMNPTAASAGTVIGLVMLGIEEE